MGGDEDEELTETEKLKKSLNIVEGDDEELRSALKVAGFPEEKLDLIDFGVLDDLKELVDSNQSVVVTMFLKEIPGLDLKTRIQLIMGLQRITPSALDPEERKQNFWYYLPFVNVIYEVFFDSPPENEMIKEILNLFGIMGALLFSLVVSIYVGMDPEKLEAMTKEWGEDGNYGGCMGFDGDMLVEIFAMDMIMSQNLSFLSFIIIMIIYMLFCTTEFEVPSDKEHWWYWVKFAVFGCFLLITLSIILLFTGLQKFTLMTYPNSYAKDHCDEDGPSMLWSTNNLWGRSQVYTFLTMLLIGAPMMAMLSYGVTCKAQSRDKRNRVLDQMAKQDAASRARHKSLGGASPGGESRQRAGIENFYTTQSAPVQRTSINPMQFQAAQAQGFVPGPQNRM